MSNPLECPPREQLHQLALGQLSEPPASNVERHVLDCDPCAQATLNLAANETLIEAMRGAAANARPVGSEPTEAGRMLEGGSAVLTELVSQLIQKLRDLPTQELSDADGVTVLSGEAGSEAMPEIDWSSSFTPAERADEIGRLSGFRILKLLGQGGMGGVFLAEDMDLQRRVALKVMRPEFAARPGATERFLREARAVAAVHNEHIVTIYQVGQATVPGQKQSVPFLAQELLHGEALDVRLKRDRQLSVAEAIRIARQIATGLAAAHERGLIHRDIKPANVFLQSSRHSPRDDRRGETNVVRAQGGVGTDEPQTAIGFPYEERAGYIAKLLDFGIARSVGDTENLTQSGMILGTPAYMAPEQARGETVDARADLFSLGCVLYRMLTGQSAFGGKDVMAILMALATHEPLPLKALRDDVPELMSNLVMKLLAKDRDARAASAREVVTLLVEIERQSQDANRRTDTSAHPALVVDQKRTGKSVTKRIGVALLSLAAMAMLAVVIVKIKTKDGKETEVAINVPGEVTAVTTEIQPGTAVELVPTSKEPHPQPDHQTAVEGQAGLPTKFITLDGLDPDQILVSERFDWQPEELVAVIGEHRLQHWSGVAQIRFHPSGEFYISVATSLERCHCVTKNLRIVTGAMTDEIARSISSYGFEFSQDGKWMFSGNSIYSVDLSDLAEPRIRFASVLTTDTEIGVADLAVHENSRLITASGQPAILNVWDITTKPARLVKKVPFESIHHYPSLSLSRDGHRLFACNTDVIQMWDIDWTNADDPTFTLRDAKIPGTRAEMHPTDSIMAAGGAGHATIDFWDVSQRRFQLLHQFEGGREFSFSPDGKQLAVAVGMGFQLYAREEAGWVKRQSLNEGMGTVYSLAWSPDQKTLVAGDYSGGIHVWDMSADPPQRRNPSRAGSHVAHIGISPDGRSMVASGADNMTTAWKLDGKVPRRLEWEAFGEGLLSSFSHDSQLVHFYGGPWNLTTNPPASVSDPITELSRFSPLEPCLISYSGDRLFRRDWGLTRRGRFTLSGEKDLWKSPVPVTTNDSLETLQFGSRRFATRQDEHTISVWNLDDPSKPQHELKHELVLPNTRAISGTLTLSPDGNVLLAFSQQGSIVWDLEETPPREYRLSLSPNFQNSFFTFDSKLLIVGDGNGVGIYDWVNNREARRLHYPGAVRQIIPHPDGKHLTTVNGNGTVYFLRIPELLMSMRD